MHKPIRFNNISLCFSHKTCFEDFTHQINYGDRIAIIGRNGSGKSTLLQMLQGKFIPNGDEIQVPADVVLGYVPQVIDDFQTLSGGQRLNSALTAALSAYPNVLLLDEPTNHLDRSNRKSLLRMLRSYAGTLIIVSHDTELLRNCTDTIWRIDNGEIHIFSGDYDDYMHEMHTKRAAIEQELSRLNRQKKDLHQALMREQGRAAKSRAQGEKNIEQRKWPTIVSKAKALRADETAGNKKTAIANKKQELSEQLADLRLPEVITPKFSLNATDLGNRTLVSITDGIAGYQGYEPVLHNISFVMGARDRVAIQGDNGSGKSTLVKAILDNPDVIKSGNWFMPTAIHIGYLDQHYETLDLHRSVLENTQVLLPTWSHAEVRRHLNDFLFRSNTEVNTIVGQLSGGEKARLSLAKIAAKTPKLLILDEVTNNLDLETREHMIQVLKAYPGAMIVISHDADFLEAIGINDSIHLC